VFAAPKTVGVVILRMRMLMKNVISLEIVWKKMRYWSDCFALVMSVVLVGWGVIVVRGEEGGGCLLLCQNMLFSFSTCSGSVSCPFANVFWCF